MKKRKRVTRKNQNFNPTTEEIEKAKAAFLKAGGKVTSIPSPMESQLNPYVSGRDDSTDSWILN